MKPCSLLLKIEAQLLIYFLMHKFSKIDSLHRKKFCLYHWANHLIFSFGVFYCQGHLSRALFAHTSEIQNMYSTECSREKLQSVLCFWKKKTQIIFIVFLFKLLQICCIRCPGLCSHRHRQIWSSSKWKTKKYLDFFFQKHSKLWSVSFEY